MNATSGSAISLRGLVKSYGRFPALRGIDLEVGTGEIFGFLGPNGAGKTTAIRCLLDLIRPNAGEIEVLGLDPRRDAVTIRRRSGYLPGELVLDDNFTSREVFRLFDRMRGGGTDWTRVAAMSSRLRLDVDKPIRNFSKGNKQKVGVIQALMHDPELLLLDEPTSGLDPLMQREVLALAREARERGATVFFSSHVLSEVEEICDRVAIVRAGEIVETGGIDALAGRTFMRVRLSLATPITSTELDVLEGVRVLQNREGLDLLVRVDGDMDGLLKALSGHRVRAMETERPSLEEIFLGYYASAEKEIGA
jgi:ABC-2 type transport system ATP-binding protein